MFCPKCGAKNDHDAKFCKGCGFNVEFVKDKVPPPPPPAPPPPSAAKKAKDKTAKAAKAVRRVAPVYELGFLLLFIILVLYQEGRDLRQRLGASLVLEGAFAAASLVVYLILSFASKRTRGKWIEPLPSAFVIVGTAFYFLLFKGFFLIKLKPLLEKLGLG